MKPAPRADNRNQALLDAAAKLFAEQGFRETTIRDIASAVGMLPGSIYYHYASKDALLLAVYEAGVEEFIAELERSVADIADPWDRLRVAMATHVSVSTRSHYSKVIARVQPTPRPKHADAMILLRDRYEQWFRCLIDDLPLAPWVDSSLLRLMILGVVNQPQYWFDPTGRRTPEEIGVGFARFLIESIARPQSGPDAED